MAKIRKRKPAPRGCATGAGGRPGIQDESGMILAAVLILLGIIVVLVLQAQMLAYCSLNLEKNKLLRMQLRKTAADSAWQALNMLAGDADLLVDSTNEEWATRMNFRLPNGIATETLIIDENRFVDINMLAAVSADQLRRPAAEIVKDLIAAEQAPAAELRIRIIQDWIDADQSGNFETTYYRKLQSPVTVADSAMESREELLWLLAAATNTEPAAVDLTVVPGKAPRVEPVNVNTASRETLLAVFGQNNGGQAENIMRLRNTAPVRGLERIIPPATLQRLAPYLSIHSSVFSIRSKANKDSTEETIYCLAQRDQSGNLSVLRWVEP